MMNRKGTIWIILGLLLSLLPRRELKRVKPEMIDKYMPKK